MVMVETVVQTEAVVEISHPNIDTLVLLNMEHESMYYYKAQYNEVQVEKVVAEKVEEVEKVMEMVGEMVVVEMEGGVKVVVMVVEAKEKEMVVGEKVVVTEKVAEEMVVVQNCKLFQLF